MYCVGEVSGEGGIMKPHQKLIRYRCTNPDHQRATKTLSDTMTIHERSWAFCPHDVRVVGHLWALENPDAPVLTKEPADLPTLG
jgi:hypothetical protein